MIICIGQRPFSPLTYKEYNNQNPVVHGVIGMKGCCLIATKKKVAKLILQYMVERVGVMFPQQLQRNFIIMVLVVLAIPNKIERFQYEKVLYYKHFLKIMILVN